MTKNRGRQKRNWVVVGILLAALAALLSGCGGDDTPDMYRVGVLSGVDAFSSTIDGFQAEMAELGYTEGENIAYDVQAAGGDGEKMKEIAAQFVADEVDLILTTTTGGVKAAKAATADTGIPVVFTIVVDPVGGGVVDDLRQPGGNITGVSRPLSGFLSKRVEILLQIAPHVERLWVPYDPDYSTVGVSLPAVREAAASLGVELIETTVSSPEAVLAEIDRLSAMEDPGFDAIQIMPDTAVQNAESWQAILAFANERGLPIVANVVSQVREGALFTISDDNVETGRVAAPMADKILKGTDPGTIPVAFGDPLLFINHKVAEALGLTVGDGLLRQAYEVIR